MRLKERKGAKAHSIVHLRDLSQDKREEEDFGEERGARGAQIPRRAQVSRNSKAKLKKELAIVPGSFVIFPCCYYSLRSP
jgi:hypothetical protein